MRVLTVLCLLLALTSPARAGNTLVLATLDWKPYVGEHLPEQGVIAAVVREAFRRSGTAVEFRFFPWARTIALAGVGRVDGYFPEYYGEKVAASFILSSPMPGGPLGFFKLRDRKIFFVSLESLRGLRIGVVQGYVNTRAFDKADFFYKDPVKDDLTNLKKLLAGRIDLMVADRFVGKYLAATHMPEKAAAIEFLTPALAEPELYLCFSRESPYAAAGLKAFNNGLESMRSDGTLSRIRKRFGF